MLLPPWEYLFLSFNSSNFHDLFHPTWIAVARSCSSLLLVMYAVRTRQLRHHPPYLELYEWLLWTGHHHVQLADHLLAVRLRLPVRPRRRDRRPGGLRLGPLHPLPAAPRRLRAPARQAALLRPTAKFGNPETTIRAKPTRPAKHGRTKRRKRRQAGTTSDAARGPSGSASAIAGPRDRPARSASPATPIHADGRGADLRAGIRPGARIEPHSNPNLTWFIVIEGGGLVRVGEEQSRVAAGEAVLWPPGVDPLRPGPTTPRCGPSSSSSRRGRRRRCAGPRGPRRPGSPRKPSPLADACEGRPGEDDRRRPPATTPRRASPSSSPIRSARQDRSELAEDPRGRAPHQQIVAAPSDRVGAIAQRPVADRPLDDHDRGAGQERGRPPPQHDPGHLGRRATSAGSAGDATTGSTRNGSPGWQTSSSRPTTSISAAGAPGRSPRRPRAGRSPPRRGRPARPSRRAADFAGVEPVVRRPFRQHDPGGAVLARARRGRGRRPGRSVSAARAKVGRERPSVSTGVSSAGSLRQRVGQLAQPVEGDPRSSSRRCYAAPVS